ncbi:MAG: thiol-disulfide oxidoreductase DCC family protein [Phycisphaerae bacterium]
MTTKTANQGWEFKIFIDYACPLCKHEAEFLRKLDKGRGKLVFEDISSPDFDASQYGTSYDEMMGSIHGLKSDGKLINGVEVFRCAYGAVGWGWLLAWTDWPVLRSVANLGYRLFARIRLRLPGRHCDSGICRVPVRRPSH